MFRLEMFGGLRLVDGSGATVPTQRRRLALLTLLAVAGARGLSRDKVVGYLWPESPGPNARHALEQLLYALRQRIHQTLFRGTDPLHLNPDLITSDVAEFEQAITRDAAVEAAELYRGPFLDGFYVGDAGEFERWVETERARLAERCATAVEGWGRRAAADRDYASAVEAWRKLVALTPLSSRAALGLISALAEAGETAEAIRHGRAHEALVRREFGAEPAPEVSVLLQRLLTPADKRTVAPPDARIESGAAVAEHRSPAPTTRGRGWRVLITAGAAGLAAVLLAVKLVGRAAPAPVPSIAVLPLRNLSADSAQEYFAAGMTDALVTRLGKTGGLRVISYTSTMRYQGTHQTLPEIAEELRVDAVVEGAVLRSGNRVRVTAQLVHARTDRQLWAETYERDLGDVLGLQDAVARAIANEVQVRLSASPVRVTASSRVRPVDPEAYDFYLRGRSEVFGRTEQALRRSIQYFERAVQQDSGFAPAWAGLSDAYQFLGQFNFLPATLAWAKASDAARRAIQLDETLSEAHTSLAWVMLHVELSWPAADREFRRAIALNPNNAWAHQAYGYVLSTRGQFSQAIGELERAMQLDPLALDKRSTLGGALYRAGRYDEALKYFREVPDPDANSESRHQRIAAIHERQGRLEEALSEWLMALRLGGKPDVAVAVEREYRSSGYAKAKRTYLLGNLHEELRRVENAYPRPRAFDIAADYALLGDRDRAFEWLERSLRDREGGLIALRVDDRFAALRSDARFRDLARRGGLL